LAVEGLSKILGSSGGFVRYADPSAFLAMLYACWKIRDCEDSKVGKAHGEYEEVSTRGSFDQFRPGFFNNSGYMRIRKMKQSYRLGQYTDFSSLVLTPLFIRFQAPNFKRQSLNVGHHD
jgi:hypothetical protein